MRTTAAYLILVASLAFVIHAAEQQPGTSWAVDLEGMFEPPVAVVDPAVPHEVITDT